LDYCRQHPLPLQVAKGVGEATPLTLPYPKGNLEGEKGRQLGGGGVGRGGRGKFPSPPLYPKPLWIIGATWREVRGGNFPLINNPSPLPSPTPKGRQNPSPSPYPKPLWIIGGTVGKGKIPLPSPLDYW